MMRRILVLLNPMNATPRELCLVACVALFISSILGVHAPIEAPGGLLSQLGLAFFALAILL